jgi:hypothetical protein
MISRWIIPVPLAPGSGNLSMSHKTPRSKVFANEGGERAYDMCGALAHVCFGPIADIRIAPNYFRAYSIWSVIALH